MSGQAISGGRHRTVVGLGKTGLACARWLYRIGTPFRVVDTRAKPPCLEQLKSQCPGVEIVCGPLDAGLLCATDELIVSPGISLKEPAIAAAMAIGIKAIGDIELFCQEVSAPIIAITGSNGKSTVTSLVGLMGERAGMRVGVGGNIGFPVLEMLEQGEKDLYVLELSSFQLETTHSLRPRAAAVLNVTPDHIERYSSLNDYCQTKHRIYQCCQSAVYNRDDALTTPSASVDVDLLSYGTGRPLAPQDFGLLAQAGETWLVQGAEKLLPVSQLKMCGQHNYANALAALALGSLAGLPMAAMVEVLREFTGLMHRCQWIAQFKGVGWFNDSKATNEGATIAALEGLGAGLRGKIILIAGGDGKGADFIGLRPAVQRYVKDVLVMGIDGPKLAEAITGCANIQQVLDMSEAVRKAAELAKDGDIVLLAPACASVDMFTGFEHRGKVFCEQVEALYG